ncbi:MAG: thiol peroxidase [Bacteroidales bacterium]|nr:thiol peroxidase [Bacteroidales bacterium]
MAKITLQGNPCSTVGNLPALGTKSPAFSLVKSDLSSLSLEDLKGKKVVLNIFPSLETGVCAASIRRFNAEAAKLKNTVVVCVSKDLPFAHKRFCTTEGIENVVTASNFRDGSFGNDYGVTILDGPFEGLNARSVVVLDEEGIVKYTEQVPEIAQEPDYEAALKAV